MPVARYGPPDDPNHSDQEPTRYANYGDQTNQGNYGDYGQRPYPPSVSLAYRRRNRFFPGIANPWRWSHSARSSRC